MTKRKRRTFSKEFKEQIVQLHASSKPRAEIIKEYELTPSSFDRWVNQYHSSVSFEELWKSFMKTGVFMANVKSNKNF